MGYLEELSSRLGINLDYLNHMFARFNERAGEDVANKLHTLERYRGEKLQNQRLYGRDMVFHLGENADEALTYSTYRGAELNPRMVELNKEGSKQHRMYDYGDFILDPVGIDRRGRMCDRGGCLPRALHTMLDGSMEYKDIKSTMNLMDRESGRQLSNFKIKDSGEYRSGGRWGTGVSLLGDAFKEKNIYMGADYPLKDTLALIADASPNFMLSAMIKDGQTGQIDRHALSYFDGKPVLTTPQEASTYLKDPSYKAGADDELVRLQSVVMPSDAYFPGQWIQSLYNTTRNARWGVK